MSVYLIAYDLHHEPRSVYDGLISALKDAKAQEAQESVWILASPYTAEQNYNWFFKFMKTGDELIVAEVQLSNTWVTKGSGSMAAFELSSLVQTLRTIFKQLKLTK